MFLAHFRLENLIFSFFRDTLNFLSSLLFYTNLDGCFKILKILNSNHLILH